MATNLRDELRDRLRNETFDIAIVGGGVNGAVAAAVLSSAGLKVALVDKGDFASSTSQESSNLVWGGIKYLESYEFSLVWDLCRSRNELMEHYPDAVGEIRFFTTLAKGFRKPRILVFLGAVLYWVMGRFRTQAPRLLSVDQIRGEQPLVETQKSQGGLEYSDCYLKDNDARFVFHFIRRARQRGAVTLNYMELVAAARDEAGLWNLTAQDSGQSSSIKVKAKVLINAGGPFADALNQMAKIKTKHRHIFSKGVHLIVRRLITVDKVLTFFADDGRLFFVIPMGSCSCIGTTDTRVQSLPALVTDEDRNFIIDNINRRLLLEKPLEKADIISERCGVRPLVVKAQAKTLDKEDWTNLSRKHEIEVQKDQFHISIFGGKLTDCLNIGRELLHELRGLGFRLSSPGHWFGEGAPQVKAQFKLQCEQLLLPTLTPGAVGSLADRLWGSYGEDALSILEILRNKPQLATPVVSSAPIIMAEVFLIQKQEQVVTLEDFLRRRTRLSLTVRHEELATSEGLKEACRILFGDAAQNKWDAYFKR